MIQLRPYQIDLIDRTRASLQAGKRAPLLVAPCGSGKTVMFSFFSQQVKERGKHILILAHRDELLDQISETLKQFSVAHSFVAPGRHYNSSNHVQVASVFAVIRRLDKIYPPDIIIIDEAHHATAGSWAKVFAAFPNSFRIGVTATPQRLSGEALGDIFDDMVVGPSVEELIKQGSLCNYRIYVPSTISTEGLHTRMGDYAINELAEAADKPTITGDCIREYEKFTKGKRAIVFCVSVSHAKHVAEQFNQAGHYAVCIDGKMPKESRRSIVKQFRDGDINIMTSCDLISEGFDLPAIEVAIMLRPTKSLALWIQQSGRALRPLPGKEHAIILDHAGNTMEHGLPSEERIWSLEGREKSAKKAHRPVKNCPSCFGVFFIGPEKCPYCGALLPKSPREVEHVEGDLVEVDREQLLLKLRYKREDGMAKTLPELIALGRKRGYKPGWAYMRMKYRQQRATR